MDNQLGCGLPALPALTQVSVTALVSSVTGSTRVPARSGTQRARGTSLVTVARNDALIAGQGAVTLDAGEASTDIQRAIPGPEPSHDSAENIER